jgi:hypothetical protein
VKPKPPYDVAILVLAFNRPALLARTLASISIALEHLGALLETKLSIPIVVSIDGPGGGAQGTVNHEKVRRVADESRIASLVRTEHSARGLPSHLLDAYDVVLRETGARRLICIEDDVDLSSWAIAGLLYASDNAKESEHVISASPRHADGSLEHQLLLITTGAHQASVPLLRDYIQRFSLDGAEFPGGYGARDHVAISRWMQSVGATGPTYAALGTSQDRLRERAWIQAGISLSGLPARMVRHRGLWGQHNTPWFALRTGQLFQRVDSRSWVEIAQEIQLAYRP